MKRLLLALCAVFLSAPGAILAQSVPAEQSSDPHERIYAVLLSGFDQGVALDRTLEEMRRQFALNPDIAQFEESNPGTIAALSEAARPIIAAMSKRINAAYRPRMISLLRSELTLEEAEDIADFYASPFGKKVIAANAANTQSANVMRAAVDQQEITTADVQADLVATGGAVLESLSQSELTELYREVAARPGLAKLTALLPKIAAVRAKMERELPTAREEQQLDRAFTSILKATG